MLQIGLTGGIGAGKSTVAAVLAGAGAVVVDADAVARDVVAPGTEGLASVAAAFGDTVVAGDGTLDRAALAHLVFADAAARRRLEAIVHPLVRAETARRVAAMPPGTVVVHDVPLLVEAGLAPQYHLVVVVAAPADERVRRLVTTRGMRASEARARIEAQADDDARRVVADVWVDTDRPRAEVEADVLDLWRHRLEPFARNVVRRRVAPRAAPVLVEPPRGLLAWDVQADRVLARLRRAGGSLVRTADHVGSTAVPGLPAKDVIDLQVGVASLADADALADAFAEAGFPRRAGEWSDTPTPAEPDPAAWRKRLHGNADPARAVDLHVRVVGTPGWRFALAFRDWMRADAVERAAYLRVEQECGAEPHRYADTEEPWFAAAWPRLEAWVRATGWAPTS